MNGSNGGLDRTVKTTISIDCYYRSWPLDAGWWKFDRNLRWESAVDPQLPVLR
jgi:hypothetical protein